MHSFSLGAAESPAQSRQHQTREELVCAEMTMRLVFKSNMRFLSQVVIKHADGNDADHYK